MNRLQREVQKSSVVNQPHLWAFWTQRKMTLQSLMGGGVEEATPKDQRQHEQDKEQGQQKARDGGEAGGKAGKAQQPEEQGADREDNRPREHTRG